MVSPPIIIMLYLLLPSCTLLLTTKNSNMSVLNSHLKSINTGLYINCHSLAMLREKSKTLLISFSSVLLDDLPEQVCVGYDIIQGCLKWRLLKNGHLHGDNSWELYYE